MSKDSNKDCQTNKSCDSVESINKEEQKQPAQPSNKHEEDSYEAQTLLDGANKSCENNTSTTDK